MNEQTDFQKEQKEEDSDFIIDGRPVSLKEFQTIRRDPKIRLIEISKHNFKTLERMYG